jgi:hypothetical protein
VTALGGTHLRLAEFRKATSQSGEDLNVTFLNLAVLLPGWALSG